LLAIVSDNREPTEDHAIKAEELLVLTCCSAAIDKASAPRVRSLIGPGLDWERVLGLAHKERVIPLLSGFLNSVCPDLLPDAIKHALKQRLIEVTGVGLVLGSEIAAVIDLIAAGGVRVLTFKGPSLGIAAFGDPLARMFGDIDLLVDQTDFAACQAHLLANDYTIVEDYVFEKTLQREGSWAAVDLHRTITPEAFPCRLAFDELWDRREMVTVFGHDVPSLSNTDHLLAHCLQTTHDRYQNRLLLAKLADIAGLLRNTPDIDWDRLLAMAADSGMTRRLLIALGAASDMFDCSLPPQVATLLGETKSLRNLGQFTGRGVLEQENRGIVGFVERVTYHYQVHERARDKLAQARMVSLKLRQAWAKSTI